MTSSKSIEGTADLNTGSHIDDQAEIARRGKSSFAYGLHGDRNGRCGEIVSLDGDIDGPVATKPQPLPGRSDKRGTDLRRQQHARCRRS